MITLGIEGTAHTLGVGIVDSDCKVYANEIDMFKPPTGGLHPREVANHHADVVARVISEALDKAGMTPKDIDLVSFSMGPGLGPCLNYSDIFRQEGRVTPRLVEFPSYVRPRNVEPQEIQCVVIQ